MILNVTKLTGTAYLRWNDNIEGRVFASERSVRIGFGIFRIVNFFEITSFSFNYGILLSYHFTVHYSFFMFVFTSHHSYHSTFIVTVYFWTSHIMKENAEMYVNEFHSLWNTRNKSIRAYITVNALSKSPNISVYFSRSWKISIKSLFFVYLFRRSNR